MSGALPGPMVHGRRAAVRGALAAGLGYFYWGLVPIYWRRLATVDAREIIAHRLVWLLVFLAAVLLARGGFSELRAALSTRRSVALNFLSGTLLTVNWLVYVWGVNHGHVIECSLGYFLVPLISVTLGQVVLHERLRAGQRAAVACAAAGVALQLVQVGRLPWIALTLAVAFGLYGLLRKQSSLGSLTGLAVETTLLAPFAATYLLWRHHTGEGALGRVDLPTHFLVLGLGVVTAVPLLLFAYGARRVPLATLGLLQYITPTVQFALGVWVFHETFPPERALSFILIWTALALYAVEGVWAQRAGQKLAALAAGSGPV